LHFLQVDATDATEASDAIRNHQKQIYSETSRLVGLFIAATLGPPIVDGAGEFLQNNGHAELGRVVSLVLPTLVRVGSVWGAFETSENLQRRLRDIEARCV
jgi:hypothetical protein